MAILAFLAGSEVFTVLLTALALVFGALALLIAKSDVRIRSVAIPLAIFCLAVSLFLPDHLKEWHFGMGGALLVSFSTICLAGSVVALLRNKLGSVRWIEAHDLSASVVLALLLGVSVWCKYKNYSEVSDVLLLVAGVGFGALFEKERGKAAQIS